MFLLRVLALIASWIATSRLLVAYAEQVSFSMDWSIQISTDWDILGPFPIHAREQQFLSPSFPLNLSQSIDFNASWPSSYADGGKVSWGKAESDTEGNIEVSFPEIRWKALRDTEGWASLQHHAVLHTQFTVYPPISATSFSPPHLRVQLIQGSHFTILPSGGSHKPRWYAGNIYGMERSLPRIVDLPEAPSLTSPTTYELYVSGDYEIRLFGDPRVQRNSEIPVQTIRLTVEVEQTTDLVVREPTQDVIGDFIEGFAFGEAIGVGIRSMASTWTVKSVSIAPAYVEYFVLTIARTVRLAPSQARIVPLRVTQLKPFHDTLLRFDLTLTSNSGEDKTLTIELPITHRPQWSEETFSAVKGSYFYATSMPTNFLALPPIYKNADDKGSKPPILALHGAGLDIFTEPMWAGSLRRQDQSWVVIPSGRTSWGLDWHGPSAKEAWSSLDALACILEGTKSWSSWSFDAKSPAILIGHSNGGQGAWYIASRFPDRVLAVVPAAGYIKSQAYIPLTMSRSAHYIDPMLGAILESSLTPDNNDLFMSNLADTPVLAIHGGDDENVPVWHSRELVSVLHTWKMNASTELEYHEDAGKPHWYPSVLNNARVEAFLNDTLTTAIQSHVSSQEFTLTVAIPAESGSLHGWRIESLIVPGRLARLTVRKANDQVRVMTANIQRFSVDLSTFPISSLWVDNSRIYLTEVEDTLWMEAVEPKVWKVNSKPNKLQLNGRIQTILSSNAPLIFVIPDVSYTHELSIALRLAHDLHTYHRLDSEIIQSSEILQGTTLDMFSQSDIVVIGNGAAAGVERALQSRIKMLTSLPGQPFDEPGVGLMFLHVHPTNPSGKMLLLQSTDEEGLERVTRLFPIRTGVTVPDWLVVGAKADLVGAAGVLSAGVWNSDWDWNGPMSWWS